MVKTENTTHFLVKFNVVLSVPTSAIEVFSLIVEVCCHMYLYEYITPTTAPSRLTEYIVSFYISISNCILDLTILLNLHSSYDQYCFVRKRLHLSPYLPVHVIVFSLLLHVQKFNQNNLRNFRFVVEV